MNAPPGLDRRTTLRHSAAGLILAMLGGQWRWTTPAAAAAADAPPRAFSPTDAAWLGALGEAIAPPSRGAGLVAYLDHHVSVPPAESLLALRYLDVAPPYIDFYRTALAPLRDRAGAIPAADDPRWAATLAALGRDSPLFLFALRLDAIDIAYGTRAGFARLGIEYLPHIEPETDW